MAGAKYVTDEEKHLIEKLYSENNLSYEEIGKIVNRTGECVGYHLRKMGIKNNGVKFKDSEFIVPKYKFRKLKYIAERKNRKFDLSIEYLSELFLKQDKKCAYTGEELTFGSTSHRFDGTASLDRIDSSLDYIEGNVQWVHKDVNMMKQQYSHEYFLDLCKKVAYHTR